MRTKSEAKEPQVEELDRRRLQDVRVLQRNLVYIIGLTMPLCREETLRRSEYFGKYGKIVKVGPASAPQPLKTSLSRQNHADSSSVTTAPLS